MISLTCSELVEQCAKHRLSKKYRKKEELVKRLEDFYAQPTHHVTCKEFFEYMQKRWKVAKKDNGANSGEWFEETATNVVADLAGDPDVETPTRKKNVARPGLDNKTTQQRIGNTVVLSTRQDRVTTW